MGQVALTLAGVTKRFGQTTAVEALDLQVEQGEVFTLLGPSGCGKTTTLRLIAGLEAPDTGTILFDGRAIVAVAEGIFVPTHKRNLGMVFQSYAIWPHMSVFDNVAYPLKARRLPTKELRAQVDWALELVGLTGLAERQAPQLSGGQQQRVALARALVSRPSMLLLDEPFSNLDAKLREQMRVQLKLLLKQLHITAIFVTHDQVEALSLSDRIAVMNGGRLEQLGAPRELYERPRTAFVRDFLGSSVLLQGTVDATAADARLAIRLDRVPGMTLWASGPTDARLGAGAAVAVAIRPEDMELRLERSEPPATNHLDGTVEATLFVGDHYECCVRLSDEERVIVPAPRSAAPPEGAAVRLILPEAGITRMAAVTLALRRRRLTPWQLIPWVLLGLVIVLVLYPIALIVQGSFQQGSFGQPITWGLGAWRAALADPGLLQALWNTAALVVVRQAIALPIAILLSWILARTDVPGAEWIEFLFWIGFFLPALPVTLGWILLFDPKVGLINQWIAALPFGLSGPFDIYSFWGIVWAHLASSAIAIKVMLLTPAFRNMDASLEEASRVAGVSPFGTMLRIMLPAMTPVLLVVLLLSTIHSLQAFEIELVLGVPVRLAVFSTQIFAMVREEPPLFAEAMALSTLVLAGLLPFIVLQRWLSGRRRYTTVSGHFKGHKIALGRWRLPAFLLVLGAALLVTVVPFVVLVMGTFMRVFGFFNIPQPWTTVHWARVFADPVLLTALGNTLALAAGTAVCSVLLYTAIAYIVMRVKFGGAAALDVLSWLPATFPGIILGLGLFWLFLENPLLRPLYGSLLLMVLALVIASMTTAVQILKSNFAQLSVELEEAALVGGGTWWTAARYVVLPLIGPTLLLVAVLSFIAAARNVSAIALLASANTRPLSLLQLDFMIESRYESAAVVGVLVVIMTTGIALLARLAGLRGRWQQE